MLITLGTKEIEIYRDESIEYIAMKWINMLDATGAGGAYIGAVIAKVANAYGTSEDLKIEEIPEFVKLGNKVGAMTVQKYGALDSIPYMDEVK